MTGNKSLGATDIQCGGTVPVTVTLNAETGLAGNPADIELVLDRSGSMQGQPLVDLKAAAKSFVDIIDQATDGALDGVIANGSRVGVVSFADGAAVNVGLTSDAAAVKSAIDSLVAAGATNHSEGITTGQAELAGSVPSNAKKMIIMTDGERTAGPDARPARRECPCRRHGDLRHRPAHHDVRGRDQGLDDRPRRRRALLLRTGLR